MLLIVVFSLHLWLCHIHCISWWPVLANIKMKAYALLMPLFIGNYLRWGFCSNGTTCICIVLSRIIWLHKEVLYWCGECVLSLVFCCDYCCYKMRSGDDYVIYFNLLFIIRFIILLDISPLLFECYPYVGNVQVI